MRTATIIKLVLFSNLTSCDDFQEDLAASRKTFRNLTKEDYDNATGDKDIIPVLVNDVTIIPEDLQYFGLQLPEGFEAREVDTSGSGIHKDNDFLPYVEGELWPIVVHYDSLYHYAPDPDESGNASSSDVIYFEFMEKGLGVIRFYGFLNGNATELVVEGAEMEDLFKEDKRKK